MYFLSQINYLLIEIFISIKIKPAVLSRAFFFYENYLVSYINETCIFEFDKIYF